MPLLEPPPPRGAPPPWSKAIHKWLLVFSWLIVVARVWFSPDGGADNDPTFGAPDRVGLGSAGGDGFVGGPGEIASSLVEGGAHDSLVAALQPITSRECCVPAVYKDVHTPDDVYCFGTCFTERACNNTSYPFRSAEEKASFPLAEERYEIGAHRKILRPMCQAPERMVPPVEWCQKPNAKTVNGTARLVDGIPPAGCRHVSEGSGSGAFQHAIIFPAAKLAFCGIPKVGITQWEQFLRFYIGAKDYPSLPHYKLDRNFLQFDLLDPVTQRRIWDDEEWTWAAFVREPAERLLSAYLDKVGWMNKWMNKSLTFEDFVDRLAMPVNATRCMAKDPLVGLGWCSDPHWRPQVYSCGISERLDRFQFIGDLHSAADHTRELLKHVGLWESRGMRFINGGVKMGLHSSCSLASHPSNHTVHVGFQQPKEATNQSAAHVAYNHAKNSKDKMDAYYSPKLLQKVQEQLYADDYKLWSLVNANGGKLSKGKELVSKLSSTCAGEGYVAEKTTGDQPSPSREDDEASTLFTLPTI